jgi:hypothetical protein
MKRPCEDNEDEPGVPARVAGNKQKKQQDLFKFLVQKPKNQDKQGERL